VKPVKEEVNFRVGEPIWPSIFKPIEPIRVVGKKQQPKKPERRGKGRDEGPGK
jgi:hypothetical protein